MCNTSIAKTKLQKLKSRTEKDLYHLRYESMETTPLTEDVLYEVRAIAKENNMECPLYKWGGEVRFRKDAKDLFNVLNILASEYSIVFDLKENLE